MDIPEFLIEKLKNQYGVEVLKRILEGYSKQRITSLRVNTLKATLEEVKTELTNHEIKWNEIGWNKEALMMKDVNEEEIKKLRLYEEGKIYLQSLSSMLPPVIMQPKENTDILDMTAAPGGKTTQIAALTKNKAHITACEMNHIRAERLKYNIEKQGATSVMIMQEDSRRLNNYFSFDQILLDAPCSGSGTIRINNKKTYESFSQQFIKKSVESQTELLNKALHILKPGHEMVYSTCSILQEENEEIIEKVLKKINAEIVPIDLKEPEEIPLLPTKIKDTICVCPNEYYDGFFVAKIKKK